MIPGWWQRSSLLSRTGSCWVRTLLLPVCLPAMETPAVVPDDHACYAAMHQDNRSLTAVNAQWEELAAVDELSGLPKRARLLERLDRALRDGHGAGNVVSLLVLAFDALKQIIETSGLSSADSLLPQVGMQRRAHLRESAAYIEAKIVLKLQGRCLGRRIVARD